MSRPKSEPPRLPQFLCLGRTAEEKKMHFYQFHIGDYKSHTHHLSPMEDLAFRRLLDHYYLHEQPIRQRDIARQIGLRDHEQEVLTVLDEFFISTENGYIHPRADAEIAKYRKLSDDGKRGAAKRWLKGGDSPPIATPIATKNQEPRTNNQEPNISICPPSGGLLPNCQHEDVIGLYHQHLPTLRRVEVWNDTRKGFLRQRWREVAEELSKEKQVQAQDVLDWFADFFQHISTSKFLTGRVNDKSGRSFAADLEWILRPSNFAKIIEGKYHGSN